jgi:hypothetical protein
LDIRRQAYGTQRGDGDSQISLRHPITPRSLADVGDDVALPLWRIIVDPDEFGGAEIGRAHV